MQTKCSHKQKVCWTIDDMLEYDMILSFSTYYIYSVLLKYWWTLKVLDDIKMIFVLSLTPTLCYYKRLSNFVACLGL